MSQHSDPNDNRRSVELPSPTGWPIVAAFGLSLVFFGLVSDIVVSVVGFLVGLFGAVGWCKDVFPHSKHVTVEWAPDGKRAMEVTKSSRPVEYLIIEGEGAHHRAPVPSEIHPYSAGLIGGVVGGIAMAIVALAYGLICQQHSIWYPINLLAAVGVPSLSDASDAYLKDFHLLAFVVALISHAVISVMVGLLYVVMLPMLPAKREWLWGGIVAPILWSIIIWASLGLVSPMMASHINWIAFVLSQVVFGATCGFMVYKTTKVETMQTWSMARRLGVEAPHRPENQ